MCDNRCRLLEKMKGKVIATSSGGVDYIALPFSHPFYNMSVEDVNDTLELSGDDNRYTVKDSKLNTDLIVDSVPENWWLICVTFNNNEQPYSIHQLYDEIQMTALCILEDKYDESLTNTHNLFAVLLAGLFCLTIVIFVVGLLVVMFAK